MSADGLRAAAEQIAGSVKDLKITDVQTMTFNFQSCVGRDDEGHGHPAPAHTKTQTITRIRTNIGLDGHFFGGSPETAATARKMILGMDPLLREPIWHKLQQVQRLDPRAMLDRYLAAIDCALWDIAGRLTGLPVHKLLGGSREKVPAYASTMCGDDIPGGLGSADEPLLKFWLGAAAASQPVAIRSLAVAGLTRAHLTDDQLRQVADATKTMGPLELPKVLATFEHCSSEAVGLALLEGLKQSKGLSGVRPETLRPRLTNFPEVVRTKAETLLASLNADAFG